MAKGKTAKKKTPTAATRKPTNVGLCSGDYQAKQVGNTVVLRAEGVHFTTGWQVFFEQSPITIFPPEYSLWHVEPTGLVIQVLTPFSLLIEFESAESVDHVVVYDADGRHEVSVERAAPRVPVRRAGRLMAKEEAELCLSGSSAGSIVEKAVGSANFELGRKLGQIYASEAGRIDFRERVLVGVTERGCHITRGQIPNGEDDTLRTVRDTIADEATP
jgi:hypothetical protein